MRRARNKRPRYPLLPCKRLYNQWRRNMGLLKKTAFALTAETIVMTPIEASAAQSLHDARATSAPRGAKGLEGKSSWSSGREGLLGGTEEYIIKTGREEVRESAEQTMKMTEVAGAIKQKKSEN